jgi:hypothetical protein
MLVSESRASISSFVNSFVDPDALDATIQYSHGWMSSRAIVNQ